MTSGPVIAFRADASLDIGTGHIMRCLTLASELARNGAACHFLCREHPGNLLELIRDNGHQVHSLPLTPQRDTDAPAAKILDHADWLGGRQDDDATVCANILKRLKPDWLVVDHYALDSRWEKALAPHYSKLMVIDDLADREHDCDLLLDQTFGRDPSDYEPWTPAQCKRLCGAQYALLRPEFAQWRDYSLARRKADKLQRLLINLGGVDRGNITSQVLAVLKNCPLPEDCQITVVMGVTAPCVEEVSELCRAMPWPTEVKVGVSNMAELMANSDLAIGAAGATSWERCCLGLPTFLCVLADNQKVIAQSLENKGAVLAFGRESAARELNCFFDRLMGSEGTLRKMVESAKAVTDGLGVQRVARSLYERE